MMESEIQKEPGGGERSVTLGKYRVIAKLGTGGMADVFLAAQQGAMNVNRLVVVKRLRDEQAADAASREMFLDEARLAARLNHANVIQTFEAGTEAGSWFLAMEYVEGQPLSRVLAKLRQQGRRMDPRLAARVCADALSGLHYAHELTDFDGTRLGIVHRDVSPQNIMLTYAGVTKIVDFGIAKAAGTSQTAHGVFKGKVAYMAPEQVTSESVDGRADVFAAGIVLWEALTGAHLMAAETPAKTLYNLMHQPIARASSVQPDVPPALDDIVARALYRDVDLRWPSAKAMRDALEVWLAAERGGAAEDLAALVTTLFEDRRRTVQEQVKAQLAALSLGRSIARPGEDVSRTHVRLPATTILDLSEGATPGSQAAMYRIVTMSSGMVPASPVPAPSRTRRVATVVWISVTALALLVNAAALLRTQRAPEAAPAVAVADVPAARASIALANASAPARAPEPNASPPAASVVTLVQAATPARAPVRAQVAPAPTHAPAPEPRAATTVSAAPAATTPPPPNPKPAETPAGRTFRRTL